jgi:hypothetical protein
MWGQAMGGNMRGTASMALACGVLISFSAAAKYVEPTGGVAISGGSGFQQIMGKTEVRAGDSVVASPGGHAKIVYDDNCVVNVDPGAVVTVQETSPCKAGVAPAAGGGHIGWYVVGAGVVGGAIAGIVLGTGGSSSNSNNGGNSTDP